MNNSVAPTFCRTKIEFTPSTIRNQCQWLRNNSSNILCWISLPYSWWNLLRSLVQKAHRASFLLERFKSICLGSPLQRQRRTGGNFNIGTCGRKERGIFMQKYPHQIYISISRESMQAGWSLHLHVLAVASASIINSLPLTPSSSFIMFALSIINFMLKMWSIYLCHLQPTRKREKPLKSIYSRRRKQNALCRFQFKFKISTLKHLHSRDSEIPEFLTKHFLFWLFPVSCAYLMCICRLAAAPPKIVFQRSLDIEYEIWKKQQQILL